MAVVLVPVVILASWTRRGRRRGAPVARSESYFGLMLLLEFFMIGVFAATDVFLFYVFFEAMLIPMYFIIGQLRRRAAAVRGDEVLPVLPARRPAHAGRGDRAVRVPAESAATGHHGTFLFSTLVHVTLRRRCRSGCSSASSSRSRSRRRCGRSTPGCPTPAPRPRRARRCCCVGVLDKVGTFGFLRYCLPLFPDASRYFAPTILILSVIGILYGGVPGHRPDAT